MAKHGKALRAGFSVGCTLFALIGCGASSDGVSGTESELTSAAASISDTAQSEATARTAARACFDAFETCAGATGADVTACRTTLKSCLPSEAPLPGRCESDGSVDVDDDSDEAADEASDADEDTDELAEEGTVLDGGMRGGRHGDEHGDGGRGRGRGHGRGGKHKGRGNCGRPDVSADRLGACTTSSDANLTTGMGATATSSAHQQCVQKAFGERLTSLCKRATELCAQADAQQDVCASITTACASVSP